MNISLLTLPLQICAFLNIAHAFAPSSSFIDSPCTTRARVATRIYPFQSNYKPRTTSCPQTTLLLAKSGTKKKKPKDGTIAVNRVAFRNYEILETLQAGISLVGTEVKSIREGKMNLRDGYVKADAKRGQAYLHGVHISKHGQTGRYFQHEEKRVRTLLLNKREARRWGQKVDQMGQGMTVVPLKAYFNENNLVKFELGLARGKNVRDKRATIKDRENKREARRMIKNFRVG